ncbi:MAG: hypothetical protein V4719_26345 [Planctomycetota bacterium]
MIADTAVQHPSSPLRIQNESTGDCSRPANLLKETIYVHCSRTWDIILAVV